MKRLFPIMCTLLLLYCPFGFAAIVWDGTSKAPWTKGSGTESDPYLIETPANLAYLAEQVQNGQTYEKTYFMQTNDIDLNNKRCQVGSSSSRCFWGIYNGGQKQVINVSGCLFGYIKSATIQNLTIAGTSTDTYLLQAAYVAGCYQVRVESSSLNETLRYIVKK